MSYGLPQGANCSVVSQPAQHAAELSARAGVGADAADVVHAGGERPVAALEGLRQSAGHVVLFEYEHALTTASQGRSSRQSTDP